MHTDTFTRDIPPWRILEVWVGAIPATLVASWIYREQRGTDENSRNGKGERESRN
jgi:hypothetical protein